jgi:hypothetical protein
MTLGSADSGADLPLGDTDQVPLDNSSRSPLQQGSAMFLSTTPTRPGGLYYVTPRIGIWLVVCTFDVSLDEMVAGLFFGQVWANGSQIASSNEAIAYHYVGGANFPATQFRQTTTAIGITTSLAAGTTIEGMAYCFGTASGAVNSGNTKLSVKNIG